jgi:hypothetical protein
MLDHLQLHTQVKVESVSLVSAKDKKKAKKTKKTSLYTIYIYYVVGVALHPPVEIQYIQYECLFIFFVISKDVEFLRVKS